MIEDSTRISLDLISNGIKVFTMNTRYNQKVKVILDTDIYNECDDQNEY